MAGVVGRATTDDMGDISKKDHRAVVARWRARRGVEAVADTEERVKVPNMGKMREEGWKKAGADMESKLKATRQAMANRDAGDRLEALQRMVMSAAKNALEAQEGEDTQRKEGAPKGAEKRGGKRTGVRGGATGQGGEK